MRFYFRFETCETYIEAWNAIKIGKTKQEVLTQTLIIIWTDKQINKFFYFFAKNQSIRISVTEI